MKETDKYSIETLCDEINLQDEVKAEVLKIYYQIDLKKYYQLISGLMSKENPFESFMSLVKELTQVDRHIKMLTLQL